MKKWLFLLLTIITVPMVSHGEPATDPQMQRFADERVRVFAERVRALRIRAADDKAAIDDIFERAAGDVRWNDARTDGPPHLLQSGDSANPDDMLVYNSFITLLEKFFAGTFATLNEANSAAAEWAVLQRACVRPATE